MDRMRLHVAPLLLLPLLALACSEEERPPPTGGGGMLGHGGTGGDAGSEEERIAALCQRACARFEACGERDEACYDDCVGAPAPSGVFEPCVECLESVECIGADLACLSGAACDMAWDLRVTASGLDEWNGRIARVLVVEAVPGEYWVDFARDVPIAEGGFDLHMIGVLPAWEMPLDVVVIVDADGDDACDPVAGDRAWRIPVGIPSGDAHVHVDGGAPQEPATCPFWTAVDPKIVLEGEGFLEHENRWVIAAPVWYDDTFLTIGAFEVAQVREGGFRFQLGRFGDYVEDMKPNSKLQAAWMIDLDGDWVCSGADVGGTGDIPPVRGIEQRVEARPSDMGAAPCHLLRGLGHDVRLTGGGYGAFEGRSWEAVLVDERGLVTAHRTGQIESGRLEARFARAGVPGAAYTAVLWVDVDGDRKCAAEDALFSWALEVGDGALEVPAPLPEEPAEPSQCALF